MGELKKRYFTKLTAWMLVFMLAFTFVPTDAFAAGAAKDITVYMTVSDKGVIAKTKSGDAMAWKEVTVKDLDESGDFTYDEALKAAHSAYNSADGYSAPSGSVVKIWGVDTTNTLFFINGAGISSGVTTDKVQDKNYLIVSANADQKYYADWMSMFNVYNKNVMAGQKFALNLKGHKGMAWTDEEKKDLGLKGIKVGTWDNGEFTAISGAVTDASGNVNISFAKPGQYIVTAQGAVANTVTDWGMEEVNHDHDGKPVYGTKNKETSECTFAYTKKDYGEGPYPSDEILYSEKMGLTDFMNFDFSTFKDGYVLRNNSILSNCPLIAPCCIVTVDRAAQKMTIKKKGKVVKASKLKKKKLAIKLKSLVKVSNAKGKVTYKVKPANKKSKKVLKYKKGKIYIKKKAKKGTYKLKVKIAAAGNTQYKAASKTVVIKIKVK